MQVYWLEDHRRLSSGHPLATCFFDDGQKFTAARDCIVLLEAYEKKNSAAIY